MYKQAMQNTSLHELHTKRQPWSLPYNICVYSPQM